MTPWGLCCLSWEWDCWGLCHVLQKDWVKSVNMTCHQVIFRLHHPCHHHRTGVMKPEGSHWSRVAPNPAAGVLIKRPRDHGGWKDMPTNRGLLAAPETGRQEGPSPGASEGLKLLASRRVGHFCCCFHGPVCGAMLGQPTWDQRGAATWTHGHSP